MSTRVSIMACFRGTFALVASSTMLAQIAAGQARVAEVKHAVACSHCRIEMTKLATFGSESDPVLLSGLNRAVSADSRGRYFAATFDQQQVAIFSSQGRFISVLGRKGDGPGEFRYPITRITVGRGDTLYIFASRTVNIFSPELKFVRQVSLPLGGSTSLLADGRFLLHGRIGTPASIGHPHHITSPGGVLERSFGFGGQALSPDRPSPLGTALTPTQDGMSLWEGPSGPDYWLVHRSITGELLDSIEFVDVHWLKEPLPDLPIRINRGWTGTSPPVPMPPLTVNFELVGVDAAGLVWVRVGIPERAADTPQGYRVVRHIEVFDPVRREMLASHPTSDALRFLGRGNLAMSNSADSDGIVSVTIWQVSLRR